MNKYRGGSYSANKLIQNELEKLGFHVDRLDGFIIAERGEERFLFNGTETSKTSLLASRLVKNKYLTSLLLNRSGVSTPEGKVFVSDQFSSAREYAASLQDFVIKPVDGNKGAGVSVGPSIESFKECWDEAIKGTSRGVLIEKRFMGGEEARYLVVNNKCIGVVMRKPPEIVGDGESTISQLVDEKNEIRKLNPGLGNRPVKIDANRLENIKKQGFSLGSVPPRGKLVFIDTKAGLSTGGEPHEIFNKASPYLKSMAEKAVASIPGLDVAGVDIIADDHHSQSGEAKYVVIEINTKPGIAGHHYPVEGQSLNVAEKIVRSLLHPSDSYPESSGGKLDIPKKYVANMLVAKEARACGATVSSDSKGRVIIKRKGVEFTFHNGRVVQGKEGSGSAYFKIIRNKAVVKSLLSSNGIPVPKGFVVTGGREEAKKLAEIVGYPVCIKPITGSKGKGVHPRVTTEEQLVGLLEKGYGNKFLIEESVAGYDARITFVGGKFVAASLRLPAKVIGDGVSSIEELVVKERGRRISRKVARAKSLVIDDDVISHIRRLGYGKESILEKGCALQLRENSNLSTGAESHNISECFSASEKAGFERIAKLFPEVVACGVDVIFFGDPREGGEGYKVIEVNSSPGILGHHYPYSGKPVNVAKQIVGFLFNESV